MDLTSPTLDMKKVNSAFEFTQTIDLREFEEAGKQATPPLSDEAAAEESRRADDDPDDFSTNSQAIYDL